MRAKLNHYYQRASLRGKLSFLTFFLFLCIFTLFTTLAYSSLNYLLLERERDHIETILDQVSAEVAQINEPLTMTNLMTYLNQSQDEDVIKVQQSIPEHHILREKNDISNLLYANQDIYLYGPNKRLLFTTDEKKSPPTFQKVGKLYQTQYSQARGYVLLKPIYARDDRHQVIGYIQLFHDLGVYLSLRNQVLGTLVILEVIALGCLQLVIVKATKRFLRPVQILHDAMQDVVKNPSDLSKRVQIKTGDEIEHLADSYNHMLNQLSEQNERQSRFISDVSHELRTPVAVIKGHLDLLNRWGKDDPEILAESLEVSAAEINRVQTMINDLLDMARLRESFEQHRHERCDVATSVKAIMGNFIGLYPDYHFSLALETAELGAIYQHHFEQALTILLDNAVKYSLDKKEIEVSLKKEGVALALVVKDYGEGISQDDLAHIFERFYRSDKSRHRLSQQSGLGIGLAILSQICDAYECRIEVESKLGQGSSFKLLIPMVS